MVAYRDSSGRGLLPGFANGFSRYLVCACCGLEKGVTQFFKNRFAIFPAGAGLPRMLLFFREPSILLEQLLSLA